LENTFDLLNDFSGANVVAANRSPAAITDADVANVIKDGKYKGFDITEGAKVAAAADNNTFDPNNLYTQDKRSREIFGKNATVNKARYKTAIDHFRANTSANCFGHQDYKDITDPKKLRGFQPGDLDQTGNATITGHDIISADE